MKTRIKLFLTLMVTILCATLGCISFYANHKIIRDAMFVIPSQPARTEIDYKQIEEKNGDDYLLTYETSETGTANILNKNYQIVLKETNYLYSYILHYPLLSGSFFTENAQKEKKKLVVFNKKAAFEIFGNYDIVGAEIKLNNEIFTIVGIMDDKDKDNVSGYIPVPYHNKQIDSFISQVNSGDQDSEEKVKNNLKEINITAAEYDFYLTNSFYRGIHIRFILAVKIFFLVLSLYILTVCFKTAKAKIIRLKSLSRQLDFIDLLKNNTVTFLFILLMAFLIIAIITCLPATVLSISGDMLFLDEIENIIVSDYSYGFAQAIRLINQLSIYSETVFTAYIVFLIIFIIMFVISRDKSKKQEEN